MKGRIDISPAVADVLSRGTWEGVLFRLPAEQLDRKLYAGVDKVLQALGGKWSRRGRGHLFTADSRSDLQAALQRGRAVDPKKAAEQFFTPPEVAAMVFDRADLAADMHVLEPSAGAGALLAEPMRLNCDITAVEQDARLADALATLLLPHGTRVSMVDFMTWTPIDRLPIDRVLMNPPFSRGQDMDHVSRAFGFLRPGGRLVAIMSPHWRYGDDQRSRGFRAAVNAQAYSWKPLPDGAFRPSGTDVSTGILTLEKAA